MKETNTILAGDIGGTKTRLGLFSVSKGGYRLLLEKTFQSPHLEINWKLKSRTFMEAFKNKGRLSRVLVHIPVKVIMNDKAALLGAANYALKLLETS